MKKYPELKKPLIGLALSAAIFIGLVVYVAMLRQGNPRVPVSEAPITITDVTVNGSSVRIDWQCDNVGATSYQLIKKENAQGDWKFYKAVENNIKYCTDNNVSNGNTYGYYVRAYDGRKKSDKYSKLPHIIYLYMDSGINVNTQNMSEIKPQLDAAITGDKVKLSWKPIANVPLTSMCIYYKNENGDWEIAKELPPYIFSYEEIKRSDEYKIVGRNIYGSYRLQTAETIVDV